MNGRANQETEQKLWKKGFGSLYTKTVCNTGRWVIINKNNAYHIVCLPSSFRPIYCGGCIQEGSWGLSAHTYLCFYEMMSVTRQARETMARQLRGVAKCMAKEKGGGLSPLCRFSVAALPAPGAAHHMSTRWNFQAGSRMESIRLPDINTVGFLLGVGATQGQFIFWTLR